MKILEFPTRYSTWPTPALRAELDRLALEPPLKRAQQEQRIAQVVEELERRRWVERRAA